MRTCDAVHRHNRAPAAVYRLSASKCAAIDANTSSGDWVQSACAYVNLRHVHEREHAWSHRLELACVLEQLENRHALCGEHSAQNSVTASTYRTHLPLPQAPGSPEALANGLYVIIHAPAALGPRQQPLHHHLHERREDGQGEAAAAAAAGNERAAAPPRCKKTQEQSTLRHRSPPLRGTCVRVRWRAALRGDVQQVEASSLWVDACLGVRSPSVIIVLVAGEAINKEIRFSGSGALYHGGLDQVYSDFNGHNLACSRVSCDKSCKRRDR